MAEAEFTIRPRGRHWWPAVGFPVLVSAVLVPWAAHDHGGGAAPVVLGAVWAPSAVLLACLARSRVTLTADAIVVRRLLGRARRVPRSELRVAVTVAVRYLPGAAPVFDLAFLGARGKRLLRLRQVSYAAGDLRELARRSGVRPVRLGVRDIPEVVARYPGLLSLPERRPGVSAAVVLAATVAVVVLAVVLPAGL
ncbi:hypothetical protein [Streptomyces spiramenti]|uniref:PH domain-containing protein n=1 Tax=Streptomyces spiramenti TaxID=2720606 RepID=A0ABX1AQ84_9ACTN|nr:hypothetical protein [Streptomyces spiramenti]NJP66462.1 hypothetical protein [Streptomyces spiramenti]